MGASYSNSEMKNYALADAMRPDDKRTMGQRQSVGTLVTQGVFRFVALGVLIFERKKAERFVRSMELRGQFHAMQHGYLNSGGDGTKINRFVASHPRDFFSLEQF